MAVARRIAMESERPRRPDEKRAPDEGDHGEYRGERGEDGPAAATVRDATHKALSRA